MKSADLATVRATLWKAADGLRANSTLAPNEYRGPVLGLIFLAYAEHRFEPMSRSTSKRPACSSDSTCTAARRRFPRPGAEESGVFPQVRPYFSASSRRTRTMNRPGSSRHVGEGTAWTGTSGFTLDIVGSAARS